MILLLCLLVKVCVVACDTEFYVLSLGDVPLFCYAQTGPCFGGFFCCWLSKSRLVKALHTASLNC